MVKIGFGGGTCDSTLAKPGQEAEEIGKLSLGKHPNINKAVLQANNTGNRVKPD
jgi:hypothetical protein